MNKQNFVQENSFGYFTGLVDIIC